MCIRDSCAAGDDEGNVATTIKATGGHWTTSHVDGTNWVLGLSCPTTSLCAGGDNEYDVLTGIPS